MLLCHYLLLTGSGQTESAVFKLWMLYFQRITLKIIWLFKTNKHERIDSKGSENIICAMMKYGETFSAATQHLTPPAMTIIKFWEKKMDSLEARALYKQRIYQPNGVKQGCVLAPTTDTIQLDVLRYSSRCFSGLWWLLSNQIPC